MDVNVYISKILLEILNIVVSKNVLEEEEKRLNKHKPLTSQKNKNRTYKNWLDISVYYIQQVFHFCSQLDINS